MQILRGRSSVSLGSGLYFRHSAAHYGRPERLSNGADSTPSFATTGTRPSGADAGLVISTKPAHEGGLCEKDGRPGLPRGSPVHFDQIVPPPEELPGCPQ